MTSSLHLLVVDGYDLASRKALLPAGARPGGELDADALAACRPGRRDLAWRLGIDREVREEEVRPAEIRTWLRAVARLRTAA